MLSSNQDQTHSQPVNSDSVSAGTEQLFLKERAVTSAVENYQQVVAALSRELNISELSVRILLSRGLKNREEILNFLQPNFRDQLPNPNTILNMCKAAELSLEAIEKGLQISVFHDFDVDGISSGAQVFLYLKHLGAKVNTYTPNRFAEGYGLSSNAVEILAKNGTQLLITLDCGISNVSEITLAKRLGLQTIVIDHHLPSKLPPADVIVDPEQEHCPFAPFKLCAAGLSWMFLVVLRQEARKRPNFTHIDFDSDAADPKNYLDLAALGTICDMVPLVGINRTLAVKGLSQMANSTRLGIRELKKVAGAAQTTRFSSSHVAFGLGPRINAAGRLDDASQVVELLTTNDAFKAEQIAVNINRLNNKRKDVEDYVKASCLEQISASEKLKSAPALALYGEDFHLGVIGIVAQRMVEAFAVPSAVMAPGELIGKGGKKEAVIKGSVRSVPGFHVADALKSLSELLLGHGGHAEAGGFSLAFDKLSAFQEAFCEKAREVLAARPAGPSITADLELKFADINFTFAEELSRLAPFGVGNPTPVFFSQDIVVDSAMQVAGKHLRLRLLQGKQAFNAVAWSMAGHANLRKGQHIACTYNVEINTYQGISSVQLSLKKAWAM